MYPLRRVALAVSKRRARRWQADGHTFAAYHHFPAGWLPWRFYP